MRSFSEKAELVGRCVRRQGTGFYRDHNVFSVKLYAFDSHPRHSHHSCSRLPLLFVLKSCAYCVRPHNEDDFFLIYCVNLPACRRSAFLWCRRARFILSPERPVEHSLRVYACTAVSCSPFHNFSTAERVQDGGSALPPR